MNPDPALERRSPPIVAILRGVRPTEVVDIAGALADAGIRILEVPLNSPDALSSIERLAGSADGRMLIGAGTVLTAAAVDDVAAAGATFVVSPNTDPSVIARTLERGLESMPGVMTPTEAMAATAAGARHLKLFPASTTGAGHIRALQDVLPEHSRVWAVGGVGAANLSRWIESGAYGVGVGGSLYRPGRNAAEVRITAGELVRAWQDMQAR
jgi:2-dehydro-3-deoxyphosphogalactonate aldolase